MRIIKPSVELLGGNVGVFRRPKHVELCGRVCYKSESKITEDSAEKFIAGIIQRGHEAVLEHARITLKLINKPETYRRLLLICNDMRKMGQYDYLTFTQFGISEQYIVSGNMRAWRNLSKYMFKNDYPDDPVIRRMWVENADFFPEFTEDITYIPDTLTDIDPTLLGDPYLRLRHSWYTLRFICDRGISHEIVRHRPASYCQESTRYCNYSKGRFNGEITVIEPCFLEPDTLPYQHWKDACWTAETGYFRLLNDGCSPQEARDVLPVSLKTELVMTATADEWLHFLRLRTAEAAHPQMRELANQVKKILIDQDSEVFDEVSQNE